MLLKPQQKITLCMIVKNEQAMIMPALESVRGLVSELCVIDTGSTDRTPEMIREFCEREGIPLKLKHRDWCGRFDTHRNQSLELATGDWVLVLDADETLVLPGGTEGFRAQVLDQVPDEVDGVSCPVEEYMDGRVVSRFNAARLFKRDRLIGYTARVHNQPVTKNQHGGLTNHMLVQHREKPRELRDARRRQTITMLEAQVRDGNPSGHFYLMRARSYLGELDKALEHARAYLDAREILGKEHFNLSVFAMAATTCLGLQRWDAMREWLNRGLAEIPDDLDLNFMLSEYGANTGQNEEMIIGASRYVDYYERCGGGHSPASGNRFVQTMRPDLYALCLMRTALGRAGVAAAMGSRAAQVIETLDPASAADLRRDLDMVLTASVKALQDVLAWQTSPEPAPGQAHDMAPAPAPAAPPDRPDTPHLELDLNGPAGPRVCGQEEAA